jgi:2',3'-cyclic-nucleotide 2'-phosphodiesterase (5'-nucleotidase family)
MTSHSGGKTKISFWSIVLVLLLLLAGMTILVVTGLARHRARQAPPSAFSIFFTCDTQGHIEPCGCATGMAGGISRRQTYLTQNRLKDFLLVDAGDVTAGPREWEVLELEYILKGYQMMGYHAVNVGRREASLSCENLGKIREQYPLFVSANVVGPDGKPVADPYRVVTLSNGYRCGIVGILDETTGGDLLGKGLQVTGAAEALGRYLPELQ